MKSDFLLVAVILVLSFLGSTSGCTGRRDAGSSVPKCKKLKSKEFCIFDNECCSDRCLPYTRLKPYRGCE
ncbi:hypothetical protein BOX15_Mlig026414g1 [Macrostomum lignano]|uniref:Uncharacterized protein n=1 Tax=Macrostomum lignano TaxID=282301 RepID=A0A267GL20_9PLAT|nr:hypothetical protein BOX15_Mlig026414g1 [Macrostomum lignano]